MIVNDLVLGILADVDAGKTTLSEEILYCTGSIRKTGRVDHGDTFLDTDAQERERGITIFSRQALFQVGEKRFTLLDTPGHVDFSAEMERTLSVLDLAILVISVTEGIRSHVYTLWKLLRSYHIPTFVFINKCDMVNSGADPLIKELNRELSKGFVSGSDLYGEETALLDDGLTEKFLNGETPETDDVIRLIAEGKLYPVYSGSALKRDGIETLVKALGDLTRAKEYPDRFSALVYKVTREKGERLSHLKVTGGTLRAKAEVTRMHPETDEDPVYQTKIEQIRLFSGLSFRPVQEASAGMVVAVTGLDGSFAGEGLGEDPGSTDRKLTPLFSVTAVPPEGTDNTVLFQKLRELEEELPELSVDPYGKKGDVRIRLMGTVQTEILKRILKDRYSMDVTFTDNRIIYKETVNACSEGVGHFEPLRHYAEVHLLIEPGEHGSGITVQSLLSTDELPLSYQRLVLTHLTERRHRGVLTGSELTDVKISLVAGKHHIKHTVGGDFRQATYRAIRHGLMKNETVILEPFYEFKLTVPSENAGRAMSDLSTKLFADFTGPEIVGKNSVLTGKAPVICMQNYAAELSAYTKGFGRLELSSAGYYPCHDPERVVSEAAYDPEEDLRNPTGSVFCEHGAGFYVPWQEVEDHMHLPLVTEKNSRTTVPEEPEIPEEEAEGGPLPSGYDYMGHGYAEEKELESYFQQTLSRNRREKDDRKGPIRTDLDFRPSSKVNYDNEGHIILPEKKKDFLLVDGYNIIHAWKELSELAKTNLDSAREALLNILADYQGFKGMTLITVFDAYRVKGGKETILKYHNIHVVYTKEAETADAYIEKTVHEIARKNNVTVATSDGLEQVIVFGEGAVRMSARELWEEVRKTKEEVREITDKTSPKLENKLKF